MGDDKEGKKEEEGSVKEKKSDINRNILNKTISGIVNEHPTTLMKEAFTKITNSGMSKATWDTDFEPLGFVDGLSLLISMVVNQMCSDSERPRGVTDTVYATICLGERVSTLDNCLSDRAVRLTLMKKANDCLSMWAQCIPPYSPAYLKTSSRKR